MFGIQSGATDFWRDGRKSGQENPQKPAMAAMQLDWTFKTNMRAGEDQGDGCIASRPEKKTNQLYASRARKGSPDCCEEPVKLPMALFLTLQSR